MEKIEISTGASRFETHWTTETWTWAQLCDRLAQFERGAETHAEYMAMTKPEQAKLKDIGGFVGGPLVDGRRKRGHCQDRQLIMLDIDNLDSGSTEHWLAVIYSLGFCYAVYSTRKHAPEAPRLRVVLLADRAITADEYQPVARAVAEMIDPTMSAFDPTTFEAERLMYWPSASADSETVAAHGGDDPVPVDDVLLSAYADWHDASAWPLCPNEVARVDRGAHQADPEGKPGLVGAFCRTYDVPAAIETFLPELYAPAGPARYTYTQGTTAAGAVVYDGGKYLYSHHSTDPAGGQLCNAWDLVRIHRFGQLDADAKPQTPANKLPSFVAMCKFAESDAAVTARLAQERLQHAVEDMTPLDDGTPAESPAAASQPKDWHDRLARGKHGEVLSTAQNIQLIIDNDDRLRGRIWVDRFARRMKCCGPFPWPGPEGERGWADTDDAGMRWYIETAYRVTGQGKITDATNLVAERHARDPVVEYLQAQHWDGTPRLDTLFIDYLGAADTEYTRAVTRKAFVAAVARAYDPGCKFDQVVILSGPQGTGKSTLLARMGQKWFSDSINSFNGKDAREAIQGVWIAELGELTALDRSESEQAKQFISQTEDWFRPAYGRRTEQYPRRCVFFGTSNQDSYLRDSTGNRRYWPVDTNILPIRHTVFTDFTQAVVDQVWAEAVVRYQAGEPLYLDANLNANATEVQEDHREADAWEAAIQTFVEAPIPLDWAHWTVERRTAWWEGMVPDKAQIETQPRAQVCVREIWTELFGKKLVDIGTREQRRIGHILSGLEGWTKGGTARCGPYGPQKVWARKT